MTQRTPTPVRFSDGLTGADAVESDVADSCKFYIGEPTGVNGKPRSFLGCKELCNGNRQPGRFAAVHTIMMALAISDRKSG
jgi:hypothetical protein